MPSWLTHLQPQYVLQSRSGRYFAQLCPALCDPMDCSLPGFSVHGIFQTRILEWIAIPSPGDLPDPGIEPRSSTLQAIRKAIQTTLPSNYLWKLIAGLDSLSILWWLHGYYLNWYSQKTLLGGREGLTVPILQARELPKGTQVILNKAKSLQGLFTSNSELLLIPNISVVTEEIFKYTQAFIVEFLFNSENPCFEDFLCWKKRNQWCPCSLGQILSGLGDTEDQVGGGNSWLQVEFAWNL